MIDSEKIARCFYVLDGETFAQIEYSAFGINWADKSAATDVPLNLTDSANAPPRCSDAGVDSSE